jgi:hypothetical protein
MKKIINGLRYDTEKAALNPGSQSAGQNSWTGGNGIIPLTCGDVQAWAERYLEPDVVEKHFGDDIQDAKGGNHG